MLKDSFASYRILFLTTFSIILHMSFHCLLASMDAAEKSADDVIENSFCMMSHLSLAAFQDSLCLCLYSLDIMCLIVDLLFFLIEV